MAGMVAALRLLERGCAVSLYESSHRLGGKAGANQNGKTASDFTTFQNLSEKEALKHLVEDLQSFLPDLREEDIRRVD